MGMLGSDGYESLDLSKLTQALQKVTEENDYLKALLLRLIREMESKHGIIIQVKGVV